jgi:hypothetical protein
VTNDEQGDGPKEEGNAGHSTTIGVRGPIMPAGWLRQVEGPTMPEEAIAALRAGNDLLLSGGVILPTLPNGERFRVSIALRPAADGQADIGVFPEDLRQFNDTAISEPPSRLHTDQRDALRSGATCVVEGHTVLPPYGSPGEGGKVRFLVSVDPATPWPFPHSRTNSEPRQ